MASTRAGAAGPAVGQVGWVWNVATAQLLLIHPSAISRVPLGHFVLLDALEMPRAKWDCAEPMPGSGHTWLLGTPNGLCHREQPPQPGLSLSLLSPSRYEIPDTQTADEKQLEILQDKANFRNFKPKPFNMLEFYDRAGHDIREMLLSCFFRGEQCTPEDFKVVSDLRALPGATFPPCKEGDCPPVAAPASFQLGKDRQHRH